MFDRLKRLYESGALNEAGLDKAIRLGWITEDQKQEIMHPEEDKNEG